MNLFNMFKKLFSSVKTSLVFPLLAISLVLGACGTVLDLDSSSSNNIGNYDQAANVENDSGQQTEANEEQQDIEAKPLTSFEDVATYIRENGELPDNFITKKEAEALGWVASKGNLQEVAPEKSIGGDRFGNREGLLPKAEGRIWYEADINYEGGRRNADRIVFSNDGLIYKTTDHYKSFTNITNGDE